MMGTHLNNIGMANGQPKQRFGLRLGHLLVVHGVNDLHGNF